jgi:hypothetical protein
MRATPAAAVFIVAASMPGVEAFTLAAGPALPAEDTTPDAVVV